MSDKDDIVSQYEKDSILLNDSEIIGIHMKERKLDPHIMKSQLQSIKNLTVTRQGQESKTVSFYEKNKIMPIWITKGFLTQGKKVQTIKDGYI